MLLGPASIHAQGFFQYDPNGNLTNVTATILGSPTITAQPFNQNIIMGKDAAFNIAATGAGTLAYQWYENGVPIQGATNGTLFLANASVANQGSYTVVVCNSYGCTTSTVPAQLIFNWVWVGGSSGDWYNNANWFPDSIPTGVDNITISGATVGLSAPVTITGTLICSNGASIISTNMLTIASGGELVWFGSTILPPSVTVSNGGQLVLAGTNGVGYELNGVWTNAGTINLASGNLELDSQGAPGVAELVNLAGGVLEAATNVSIQNHEGTELLLNAGTLTMSGGPSGIVIGPILTNAGLVEVQGGTLSINGGGSSSNGVFEAGPGTTLQFGGTYIANNGTQFSGAGTNLIEHDMTVNGSVVMSNVVFNGLTLTLNGDVTGSNLVLNGQTLMLNGTLAVSNVLVNGTILSGSNGVVAGGLTCTGGQLTSGSALTVASNGVVVLNTSSTYMLRGVLTNAGTIELAGGSLTLNSGDTSGQGQLINLPGAFVDITADVPINDAFGNEAILNEGILEKTGGTGSSFINPILANAGTVNAQTGTINVNGSHALTAGELDIGISGATNFGVIHFAGSASLNSTGLKVNLENGYQPSVSNSFAIITYGSESGPFNYLKLPNGFTWSENYGASSFVLSVAGIKPFLIPNFTTVAAQQLPEFSLQFLGNTNALYTVLAATNLAAPLSNWATLGNAMVLSNNLYQFIDSQSTNFPARFYLLQSP